MLLDFLHMLRDSCHGCIIVVKSAAHFYPNPNPSNINSLDCSSLDMHQSCFFAMIHMNWMFEMMCGYHSCIFGLILLELNKVLSTLMYSGVIRSKLSIVSSTTLMATDTRAKK